MALPELPEGINLPEIEAEIERRCAHEAENVGTRGATVSVLVPSGDSSKSQSFVASVNQAYKNLAKALESSDLPESKVDISVRLCAAFKFLATCAPWGFHEAHFNLFQNIISALLAPKTGICDLVKESRLRFCMPLQEWRAECKPSPGKDLSAEARKKFNKALNIMVSNLKLLAEHAITKDNQLDDALHQPPGDGSELEALLASPQLTPERFGDASRMG
eukprot:s2314_g7.t1